MFETARQSKYDLDPELYAKLVDELYAAYPDGVTLPPEYASFVDNNLMRFLIRLARYKFVARMLKKTDRVLEVGSGSGLGSMFLAQHAARVTGLDVKEHEVFEARAMNRRDNVEFVAGDFFEMDADDRYDAIVMLDVIEHMDVPLGRRLVETAARHLESTGMLVIGTPSAASYPHQGALSRASHVHCYEQGELLGLIGESFGRTLPFSMNDEVVHTGHPNMAWYYFVVALCPNHNDSKGGRGA